ncbi:exosporium morphogenetic protein CdeC [Romboutsia sp.]|uniref:exosporium morphogenetic protein CdeC n=1 Tax=Romboutsia sp. TaxID=1965302 RepID=UPI003F2A6708
MKDMKRVTKKVTSKPVAQSVIREEAVCEELDRGCKSKGHQEHETKKMHCECECECTSKPTCEPCKIDATDCIDNVDCGPDCCCPIVPPKFSTSNCTPYAIEASRIYDTMQFQTFTDALGENGEPLCFEYEVLEVRGPVPRGGQVNVTIDKVCLNYSSISIIPGVPSLEDYEIELIENERPCETTFDYAVCLEKNSACCRQGKGQNVVYKQKGVAVMVEDLVLELRGKCGCTEIVALAYPSTKPFGGQKRKCNEVEFIFNTLSAPICLPADGRNITLRQDFQANLTVDCVGKALLKHVGRDCCDDCCDDFCGHEQYKLCIPNDIDLICCLQVVVSILINEQIVVLGASQVIKPRVVDTFAKVCDFSGCGDTANQNQNKKGHCGC